MTFDPDDLRAWIGREERASDLLTPALAERFHATFDLPGDPPAAGEPAPRAIHWCLCLSAAPTASLAADGHPARGLFLPPVPLPRRMWAAGELRFHRDLHVGAGIERRSRIADVAAKAGRSGALVFVEVDHRILADGELAVEERQTLVYREAVAVAPPPVPPPDGMPAATWAPTATLLLRYSALTFNAHRIHYDRPYATGVEGYADLVVHAPLQATILFELATRLRGAAPARFGFRGIAPLVAGTAVDLHARSAGIDALDLWTAARGAAAMRATARW